MLVVFTAFGIATNMIQCQLLQKSEIWACRIFLMLISFLSIELLAASVSAWILHPGDPGGDQVQPRGLKNG